jgi:hypothetical protein
VSFWAHLFDTPERVERSPLPRSNVFGLPAVIEGEVVVERDLKPDTASDIRLSPPPIADRANWPPRSSRRT